MILSKSCFLQDKCRKYQLGKCELDADYFCIKLFKLNYLFKESLLTDKQRQYTPIRFDADGTDKAEFKILKNVENNIEKFVADGGSLYVFSHKTGNGKTLWAERLIQSYLDAIWHKCDLNCKALFINVPTLFLALKDNIATKNEYIEHIKANILTADFVVWDEIGTKAVTPFEHEHLLSFINNRIDNGKAQMFTSNLSPSELREVVGERLYSRVTKLSTVIEFKGADKREVR